MKGVISFFVVILFLSTFCYATTLQVGIYQPVGQTNKDFGNIDAKPGDVIEAFVEAENRNQDRTDDDIDDIAITLLVDDLMGDDYEIIFDDFDLKPRKKKSLPFTIEVPYRVEEDSYGVFLDIEAEENREEINLDEEIKIVVSKETHQLFFRQLELVPTNVDCGDRVTLTLEIYNIGRNDEAAELFITNTNLGLEIKKKLDIEAYPGSDTYSEIIPFDVPMVSGSYNVDILLKYAGLNDRYKLNLGVTCETEPVEETKNTTPVKVVEKTYQTRQITPETVVVKEDSKTISTLLILLILIIVAVVVLISIKRK